MLRVQALRRGREDGYYSAEFIAVVAFSLLLLVLIANVIVVQYGRGVVRAAAEEGAQAGSRLESAAGDCVGRSREVIDGLLGGPFGADVRPSCVVVGNRVEATVAYSFSPWLPLLPTFSGSETSIAIREPAP